MATDDSGRMSLLDHFRELRKRTVRAALSIAIFGSVGWIFYTSIIRVLTKPVCNLARAASTSHHCGVLYIDGVLGPLNLQISVAIVSGVILASPFWLYQLWAFVAPALHKREKKYALFFILVATPFFAFGAALAYWILPFAIRILLGFTPSSLTNLIKFSDYLTFVLHLILLFGLAFELPVFLVALNFAGVLSGKAILKPWRLAVFGITLFSATFVPTSDPFTMGLLAIPLIVFYFAAAGIAIVSDRRRALKSSE
ncbi:MAG: twin-arginine translocase subunit TatC [Actinomycetota bacterium]